MTGEGPAEPAAAPWRLGERPGRMLGSSGRMVEASRRVSMVAMAPPASATGPVRVLLWVLCLTGVLNAARLVGGLGGGAPGMWKAFFRPGPGDGGVAAAARLGCGVAAVDLMVDCLVDTFLGRCVLRLFTGVTTEVAAAVGDDCGTLCSSAVSIAASMAGVGMLMLAEALGNSSPLLSPWSLKTTCRQVGHSS